MSLALVPTGLISLALMGTRAAARPVIGLLGALVNRNAVMRLAELDDRALKDIGLVRSDVAGALGAPLHVDPSAVLALRRGERTARGAPVRSRPGRVPTIPHPALR